MLSKLHLYIEENFLKISEADIHTLIKESFSEGTKFWHPHKVRFGQNTRCSFRDPSTPDIQLQKGDLYFIDMGPVIDGHEADVGQTFCLGNPTFKNPAELLFRKLEKIWREEGLTGLALYDHARKLAKETGYILNDRMQGHRLGDFPHALFHRGGLKDFESSPHEMLWVLEIHLLEKNNKRGYFFEDILGVKPED